MAFDPTRNIDRFYVVQVLPTLFGDWTVLREWGRRGSPGTMRLESIMKPRPPSSARSAPAAARLSGRERHCLTTARWLATINYITAAVCSLWSMTSRRALRTVYRFKTAANGLFDGSSGKGGHVDQAFD